MTWPSVDAPASAPADHGEVRTQAYYAGGGDYFRSGYYSHGFFTSAAMTTLSIGNGAMYLVPLLVPVRRAFDRIGVDVTTAATSGGLLRFGLYGSSGGLPSGAPIVDGDTVSSETSGAKEVTVALTLDPGVYWRAVVAQVAGCTVRAYATNTTHPWYSDTTTPPSSAGGSLRQLGVTTGGLPSIGTLASTSGIPAVCLRAT